MMLAALSAENVMAQKMTGSRAVSAVFGDGVKVTKVILDYNAPLNASKLSTGSYKVDGREITSVYVSPDTLGAARAEGSHVVIELKSETVLKAVRPEETQDVIQGPTAGAASGDMRPGNGGPQAGGRSRDKNKVNDTAVVTQLLPIYMENGSQVKPSGEAFVVRTVKTLIADDFKQLLYHDANTGIDLKYNLFLPKDYDPTKRYPMVLFIHDASGAGRQWRNTLLQGNGATVWASPEWQAKHPCIVVAPQFDRVTEDDSYTATSDLDACLALVDYLKQTYAVDSDRIYTTGQSMGCMSSYVLMTRRPNLFASAMLVAGQWDPSVLAPLAKKNLWLISCTGDVKSSQGVEEARKVWEANGATFVTQEWPLDTTKEARQEEVNDMLRRGGNIHYSHLLGGSHNNTWRIAYDIDGIREWLFDQHRPLSADSLNALLRDPKSSYLFVAANKGDYHGTTSNSIKALEKAIQKGATMAQVDIKTDTDGETLLLGSGQSLAMAMDSIGNDLLLLVKPDTKDTERRLASWLEDKAFGNQFIVYGSHVTDLPFVGVVNLDKKAKDLKKVLKMDPVAVELDFANDDNPYLTKAIAQVKKQAKLLFNTTTVGLSGTYVESSGHPHDPEATWGGLIEKGVDIILTNQIKPLLNWLNSKK